MNPADMCLSRSELPRLLSGDLPLETMSNAEQHLAECPSCRHAIESMIADDPWWDDARQSLAACSSRSLEEGQETHDADLTRTEQLLELLGPTDDPAMLGRIGAYEVVGILGHGGMGVVFKGFDGALHRFVAIKMLLPHLATSGAARQRFAREAQAAAAVVDDHVMAIHGVSQWKSVPFFVMPYARGVSLQKRLTDHGPLELREILRIGMQTAKGLAAAHAQGLVHRDVKPANIFLDEGVERVRLMDFGLARAVDDASLTRTGTIAGTPQYMSPEQARGQNVDSRSDLFGLGSVLYAMCTGRPPFRADNSYAILRMITDEEPRSIREINPDIPEWLSSLIARLMAKSPDDRLKNAQEAAELLEQCLAHVQQPTSVPLPTSLTLQTQAIDRPFFNSRKGRLTMLGTIGTLLLGMVMMQMTEAPDIHGRWHGEEWGSISIESTKPGQYSGAFRGSDMRPAGKLQLTWSRLERRYNGTWRTSDDRGGKISLHLVDDAIHGAWTTDKESVRDASTPRLADLHWTRNERPTESVESLAVAVEALNERVQRTEPNHEQPPLTVDELVACASWNVTLNDDLSKSIQTVLRKIANERRLPSDWEIEAKYVDIPLDAPSVRAYQIALRSRDSSETFTVRERYLSANRDTAVSDPASEPEEGVPLASAIKRFNSGHSRVRGQKQPPITEDEVVAAIVYRQSERDNHDITDSLFERFQDIARHRTLPEGITFELISDFSPGDERIYTIWSVRIKLPQDERGREGWTYAFEIRKQFIAAKPFNERPLIYGQGAGVGIPLGASRMTEESAQGNHTINGTIDRLGGGGMPLGDLNADSFAPDAGSTLPDHLVLVFESSDSIDTSRTIKFMAKGGLVEVRPGTSVKAELAKPVTELAWHAGDAPEMIGDGHSPFTHVWCHWQSDGKIRWKCYGPPQVRRQ